MSTPLDITFEILKLRCTSCQNSAWVNTPTNFHADLFREAHIGHEFEMWVKFPPSPENVVGMEAIMSFSGAVLGKV